MSRTGRAFKGALTGVIQYTLQLASQTFVVPFALATAGQETLGAYAALIQFVGYLGFIDFGFGSAASWYLATAFGQMDDGARFRATLFDIRTVLFAINSASALLLLAAATHVKTVLSFSGRTAHEAELSLLALAIWAFAKTPFLVYSMCLRPTQQLAAANACGMMGNAVRLILLIVMLKSGAGVFALVVATLAGDLASTLAQAIMFKLRFPALIPQRSFEQGRIREMFGFGMYALLANSGAYLISGTDNLVVNKLFGSVQAAIYYSSYAPAQILWQVIFRLPSSAAPAISELYSRGECNSIRRSYHNILRYGFLLSIPFALMFFVIHRQLIDFWVGDRNYAGRLMTLSLSLVILFSAPNAICGTFLTCIGQIKTLSGWVMAEGVTNLVFSLLLARKLGPEGVALGTALAAFLFFPIYLTAANRKVGSDFRSLYQGIFRRLLWPTLAALAVAVMSSKYATNPVISLLFAGATGFAWVAIAWTTAVTKDEKREIMATISRITVRRRRLTPHHQT